METNKPKKDVMKIVNTVLLTFITLIMAYGTKVVGDLTIAQNNMQVEMAILGKAFLDHIDESKYWKEKIDANELKISEHIIEDKAKISKEEALEAIDQLRFWVENNYERQDDD